MKQTKKPKFITDYFRDEISLGFKITIIEAIRNIGKTSAALNFFKENVFNKSHFDTPEILGIFRNTQKELQKQLTEIAMTMGWRVKKDENIIVDKENRLRVYGTSFNSQSGEKSGIEVNNEFSGRVCNFIWWDEYADIKTFMPDMWKNFHERVITFARNNQNLRIILTGNADNANNPILTEFGVDTTDINKEVIFELKEDIFGNDISDLKIMRYRRFLTSDFDMEGRDLDFSSLLARVSYSSNLINSGEYVNKNAKQILPIKYFIKGGFEPVVLYVFYGEEYLFGSFKFNDKKVWGVISAYGHIYGDIPIMSFDDFGSTINPRATRLGDEKIKNLIIKLAKMIKFGKLFTNSHIFMQNLPLAINRYGISREDEIAIF